MSDLDDLITRVQREFGDENEIQITKADIVRWANDGQLEIIRRTSGYGLVNGVVNVNCVVGTSIIALADFIAVEHILAKDILSATEAWELQKLTRSQMHKLYPQHTLSGSSRGKPTIYYFDRQTLNVWPIPDQAYPLTVKGSKRPQLLVDGGFEDFLIPEEMYDDLVQYCLRRAFELNADWEAASVKSKRFHEQTAESMAHAAFPYNDSYPVVQDVDGYWD